MTERFVMEALAVYISVCVVATGSILYPFREWFKGVAPFLKIGPHSRHFIECRLCLAFWASVLICGVFGDWLHVLPVYGLAYFLSTQERMS